MTKQDISDDLLQFLLDRLNEGYQEYKRNHPDFAKVVQEQEGKPDWNSLQAEVSSASRPRQEADKDHCSSCGEWLADSADLCPACGMIQK